ncbi:MAG: PAS domain S-box protein [Bacteroidota bacterium]|nr:PAS domain S-box protein [Bacteroidota bacterium]
MRTKYEKISFWAFLIVIVISAIALAGWLSNKLFLAGMGENFIPMAPGTALSFILTGIASLNLLLKKKQSAIYKIILFCVLAFNFLVLIDFRSGYPIEIEQIFGPSPGSFNNFPIGRMSPVACILFLISGVSLLLMTTDAVKSNKLSIFLSSAGIIIAFIVNLVYLFRDPLLYDHKIIPLALSASIAFTFLFIGILSGFGTNELPLKLFIGESLRARLMRNFLPVTLLIILIAGWFDAIILQYSNDQVFATALVTIFSLFVLGIIIFKLAKKIGNDIDHAFAFRKEAEEILNRERKLLRTLIDNLPATIYVKDAECRKIIANRADLGVVRAKSEDEVLGKTDLDTFDNEIGKRGYADDKKVIDSGEAVLNREEDFYDINGAHRWFLTSKIPLTDESGKIIGLVGFGNDITEQKQAQEKILKLSKAIEQSPVSIEISDIKGIIEYVNPQFCVNTGYSSEEIIGKHVRFLKSGNMPEEIYKDLWKTISSGNVWQKELLNRKKDGSMFLESVILTSIKNDKGIITNYIAIKEDITDRKKMQVELIEAKEKAEESDRLKSAFLANMSHEIRTPLNSIIGFSELLSDPYFDQEQKDEFIRTIVDNGNSLLVVISDIMDFSMLETSQMKIRNEVISTRKLLHDIVNDFSSQATQKGIEIRIDQSQNSPDVRFESDSYRIKQIFNNLIGNALKFTNEGYIEIGYKIHTEAVEFHVKDTGIGISPENHQAIFERFRQIDSGKTRKYGGNGLGLAISRNLVKLLGGNIWVESEVDKFSDFFFTIPINTNL